MINTEKKIVLVRTKLTELNIPKKLEELYCMVNYLTELKLNKDLKQLFCQNNKIKSLVLNKKLEIINCDIFVEVNNINNDGLTIQFI